MSSLVPFPLPADLPEFDISELLQEVVEALDRESLRRRVPIEIDAPPYLLVHGERRQLRQLLFGLIANALASSPAGSQIVITAVADDEGIEVEVADDRSESVELLVREGLAPRAEAGPMSWLELQQVVAACGGRLAVCDCAAGGLAATVQFPRVAAEDAESKRAA